MLAIQAQKKRAICPKTKTEHCTTVITLNPDETGAGFARQIAVAFDEGIVSDWADWLSVFNSLEGEDYAILGIHQIDTNKDSEF